MPDVYRIYGSELSPYSVKVRSYCRYKGIPHEWRVRNRDNLSEYQKYARLPLIPLVITPEETGMQDSTPIIEALEERHREPPVHPEKAALRFLSALLEEFGDEWGNKWMFHYRWTYEADQVSAAERIARENAPGASAGDVANLTEMLRQRMVPRLYFVGSSEKTRDQIESSFRRALASLEAHLASRPFLFGGRPAFADFGLAPQLYQCRTDPTPGGIIAAEAPRVDAWVHRMLDPRAEGEWESFETLEPTLVPILEQEIGGLFLPWSDANARAISAGEDEFSVRLEEREFTQRPQKYHAKSLGALRVRYAAVGDAGELDPILARTGCLAWLRASAKQHS